MIPRGPKRLQSLQRDKKALLVNWEGDGQNPLSGTITFSLGSFPKMGLFGNIGGEGWGLLRCECPVSSVAYHRGEKAQLPLQIKASVVLAGPSEQPGGCPLGWRTFGSDFVVELRGGNS